MAKNLQVHAEKLAVSKHKTMIIRNNKKVLSVRITSTENTPKTVEINNLSMLFSKCSG